MADIPYTGELIMSQKGKPTELVSYLLRGGLVDYSDLSTITGFSSYTTQKIEYVKIGKLVTVFFNLAGVSNATSLTFTLPYSLSSVYVTNMIQAYDNSSDYTVGMVQATSSLATCYTSPDGIGWTASNNKRATGQFLYFASE